MQDRKRISPRAAFALAALAGSALVACAAAGATSVAEQVTPVSQPAGCMRPTSVSATHTLSWTTSEAPGAATPAEWCASVGPAFVRDGSVPASQAVDELAVVTWNVRVGGGDVQRFVEDLRSGALTGRPVHDFVLLLQEAYRAGPEVPLPSAHKRLTARIEAGPPTGERTDVAELARRLALHAVYVPSMPNGAARRTDAHAEDRGNAILSTLPLARLSAFELPFEVQRRVAVAGTVAGVTRGGTRWSLRVASGHLDTRSRWSRVLDSFGTGRARQASALGEWLGDDPALLGADLNTWGVGFLEDALEILYARFPETPRIGGTTYAAGVVRRRLDHLLFRLPEGHAAEVRRVSQRYGSDHHPLVGLVRFPAAAAVAADAGAEAGLAGAR